ncbi:serine/threonine-protein kinase [Pseudonocardia humida]|uniref:Serine/threonine protein kinase n=1 Tax=Pseudonocardia humida TaxID=2800819 RepID=A0ABT1A649_9PSEU|nr:serine/threonine-protein kinase [Pseudonocardia humida]MCO1658479.1 serine/threonine protein kinase [Pseudonocardia humida]
MQPLQPEDPEWLGRFRIEARLGVGGMGRVYLASTPEGRRAAVKMIRDDLAGDTGFRHRFRREVSAALSVAGLFTARVLDADPDADQPWLATEYVEGPSLADAVATSGPMPPAPLAALARGLAEALGAIHAAGLVHRDLKPANVLLSPAGPKVIDFGIAWSAGGTQLTGTGQVVGTPEYMAPEQISGIGPGGPPIDVFALGSTLVFAATGRSPFAADQAAAALFRIVHGEPDLTGVPGEVRELVRACLDKDPARRPTAQRIAVGLRGAGGFAPAPRAPDGRETADITAPPATLVERAPTGKRRTRVLVAVAAAVLVAAGTTLGITLSTAGGGTDPTTGPTTPVAAGPPTPSFAPDSPEVRYVDRLCASGELLVSLADTTISPTATGDAAAARRDYLTSINRVIGIVDTALPDFVVLRDDAPDEATRAAFGQVVEEFTSARESYVEGRDAVQASEPLTVQAYSTGVEKFTDGTRNLALGATIVQGLTLPDSFAGAYLSAPHCAE